MKNKCETHRVFSLLISSVQRMKKNLHLRKKIYFVHIASEILILYKCLISFISVLSIPFPHNLRRQEFKFLQIYCFPPKKEAQKLVFLILTIFRRIFRDRLQFTDLRRQNSHLLAFLEFWMWYLPHSRV